MQALVVSLRAQAIQKGAAHLHEAPLLRKARRPQVQVLKRQVRVFATSLLFAAWQGRSGMFEAATVKGAARKSR